MRNQRRPPAPAPIGRDDPRLARAFAELKGLVRAARPEVRFGHLAYADTEGLWMVEAYTSADDQLAVAELTTAREAELLVEDGICVAIIPMPLALWTDDLADGE
jgi:hypothetical protein